jgi:2-amino-4-hydroxy-6-hydroxymethyldihydropteridine diphosphokinase
LLERALAIEQALHRVRGERWDARTIDVDIVAYDELISQDAALTIPHARAHERAFVLVPWRDVDPAARLPGRGSVAELIGALDALGAAGGVKRRDDLSLQV